MVGAAAALAGCASTTDGAGRAGPATSPAVSTPSEPTPIATEPTSPETATISVTQTPSETIHAAPSAPLRTATVHAADGATYVIKIWADVQDDTCFDHAHGGPIVTFLTQHPCGGLHRYLATTTVHGRPVGFNESATGFPGTAEHPYRDASRFADLEEQDGTGSIDDLLMDGYRLPSGPTSVPADEAFNVLGQDQGVTVWDAWYLDGATPTNDPALIKMTQDVFLQF